MKQNAANPSGISSWVTVVWAGAGIIILGSFVILLWKVGLFNESNSQSGAQVIAAALALLGVIATASVSLVGYLLKKSFDQHSLRLQQATEDRLRQETALQAVKLMSTQDGKEAPVSQRSGALFALVTLDQIDLALALVENLLRRSESNSVGDFEEDAAAAIWVIERAFQSSVPRHQLISGGLLHTFRRNLYDGEGSFFWPECFLLDWDVKVDPHARYNVLLTLAEVLPGQAMNYWKETNFFTVMTILQNAVTKDPNLTIKAGAMLVQAPLLKHFGRECKDDDIFNTYEGTVTFGTMRSNLEDFRKTYKEEAVVLAGKELEWAAKAIEDWIAIK